MDTREDIPRISIENAQNWQRLESGYKKAVLQRFEEDVNNSGLVSEMDALQAHILWVGPTISFLPTPVVTCRKFIDQTSTTALPNLRINGQPYGHLDDNQYGLYPIPCYCYEYSRSDPLAEPFDEALDRRIWSLADTRMQWLKRIAETRRKLPEELATELAGKTKEHQESENHTLSDAQMREPVASDSWLCKGSDFDIKLFPWLTVSPETYIQKLTTLVNELDQVRIQ